MSRDLRKNSWIKLYTRKLENLFVQKWNEERNKILRDRKSKLELYSSIKANYGFEKYIDFIKDTRFFFYKNNFIRTTRPKFGQKLRLQRKNNPGWDLES